MALMRIRLELARTREFPEGNSAHGYDFVASLDADAHLDRAGWTPARKSCTVRRFVPGEHDQAGILVHGRHGWAFSYEPGEDDDEPIFKFDRHRFVAGEYVMITEHDGIARPFRIASVRTV